MFYSGQDELQQHRLCVVRDYDDEDVRKRR